MTIDIQAQIDDMNLEELNAELNHWVEKSFRNGLKPDEIETKNYITNRINNIK